MSKAETPRPKRPSDMELVEWWEVQWRGLVQTNDKLTPGAERMRDALLGAAERVGLLPVSGVRLTRKCVDCGHEWRAGTWGLCSECGGKSTDVPATPESMRFTSDDERAAWRKYAEAEVASDPNATVDNITRIADALLREERKRAPRLLRHTSNEALCDICGGRFSWAEHAGGGACPQCGGGRKCKSCFGCHPEKRPTLGAANG